MSNSLIFHLPDNFSPISLHKVTTRYLKWTQLNRRNHHAAYESLFTLPDAFLGENSLSSVVLYNTLQDSLNENCGYAFTSIQGAKSGNGIHFADWSIPIPYEVGKTDVLITVWYVRFGRATDGPDGNFDGMGADAFFETGPGIDADFVEQVFDNLGNGQAALRDTGNNDGLISTTLGNTVEVRAKAHTTGRGNFSRWLKVEPGGPTTRMISGTHYPTFLHDGGYLFALYLPPSPPPPPPPHLTPSDCDKLLAVIHLKQQTLNRLLHDWQNNHPGVSPPHSFQEQQDIINALNKEFYEGGCRVPLGGTGGLPGGQVPHVG